jgi:hypothetical protein
MSPPRWLVLAFSRPLMRMTGAIRDWAASWRDCKHDVDQLLERLGGDLNSYKDEAAN